MAIFHSSLARFSFILTLLTGFVLLTGCSESDNADKDTRSAESHLTNGNNYVNQGQYRAAMLEIRNAIKKAPSATSIGALVDIYNELGQSRAALSILEDNVAQFPSLNLQLASTYVSLSKYFSAEEALAALTPTDNNRVDIELLRAKIALGKGDLETGNSILESILASEPRNKEALNSYFVAGFNSASPSESEKRLQKLVEAFPEDPEVLFTLAKVRFLQKDFTRTEEHLMKALHLAPQTDIMTPLKTGVLNLLSKTLTQQGRFADAVPFEKLLKDANPDMQDVESRLAEAIAAIQAGNIELGEEQLEKLKQDFPNMGTTDVLLGLVSLEQGNANKASQLFENTVDPETAAPKLSAAAALAQLRIDEKEKALAILQTAIQKTPDSLQLLSLYGLAAIGDPNLGASAAQALEQAIALGTPEFNLYGVLTEYYFTIEKNSTKALAVLSKARGTFSDVEQQLMIYGTYLKYNHTAEGNNYARQLQSTQKQNEAGWIMLGANAIKDGDYQAADKELQKSVQVNPASEKGWYLLGSNAISLKQWQRASNAFSKAIALNPNSAQYLKGLLIAERSNGAEWDSLVETFAKQAVDANHKVKLYGFLAEVAIANKEFEKAEALITTIDADASSTTEQIAFLETQNAIAKSRIEFENGRTNKAVDILEAANKRHPATIQVLVKLGNVYLEQGSVAKAERISAEIKSLDQPVIATLFEADILVKSDRQQDALAILNAGWTTYKDTRIGNAIYHLSAKQKVTLNEDFLRDWNKTDPQNYRPLLTMAMNAQAKASPDTLSLYEKTLALAPNNVAALNNVAWLHQEQGRLKEAEAIAMRAVELAPESASVLDTAGYIKLKMGKAEAVDLLKKAATLAPDEKDIQEHYKQAKKQFR